MRINDYVVLEIAMSESTDDTRVILAHNERERQYVTAVLYAHQGAMPETWDRAAYYPQAYSAPGVALQGAVTDFNRRVANR